MSKEAFTWAYLALQLVGGTSFFAAWFYLDSQIRNLAVSAKARPQKRAPTSSNMGPEQIADWPEKTADWLETIGDWPVTIAESFFALSVAFAWVPACKFSEYASQLCSSRFLLFLKVACSASGSDSAVKSNWKPALRSNISATDKLLIKSPIKTLGFISSQRHLLQGRSVHTGCSTGKSENGYASSQLCLPGR